MSPGQVFYRTALFQFTFALAGACLSVPAAEENARAFKESTSARRMAMVAMFVVGRLKEGERLRT